MKYIFCMLAVALIGCGKDNLEKVVKTHTETITTTVELTDVAEIVAEKNEYRLAAGQAPLVKGLVCTLHNVTSTTPSTIPNSLPSSVGQWGYEGSFDVVNSSTADGLPIIPVGLRANYKTWYVMRCQGQLVVTKSMYYNFAVESDDASMLYINNSLTVDNNGLHGTQVKYGTRLLERGIHTFRLDYMQATGMQSLIVSDQDGVISAERFYR